ncbi:MAG: hypothetical protein P4L27_00725 [Ignavibacteriaceae bacterium]|nr:hypothetical protein [Ignavibacteriaceae bacterium]
MKQKKKSKVTLTLDPISKQISNSNRKSYSFFTKVINPLYKLSTNTGLQLALIVLLPLIIYSHVIHYGFLLDDETIIKDNIESLSDLHNISDAFMRDAFFREPQTSSYILYRPIQTVSYMIDASISGADPWMYHFTNLILHLFTCIALYYMLLFFNFSKATTFLGTLIFSVHPMLAGDVSWIGARGDLLIGFSSILLVLTMGYYFKTNKPILYLLHVFIFLISVFAKETIILFPLLLILYYFISLKHEQKDKRIIKFIVSWIFISGSYLLVKSVFFQDNVPNSVFGVPAFIKNLDFLPAVISKVIIPVSLPLFPLFDSFSVISGLFFILISLFISFRLYKRKNWLPLFGLIWFMLLIIPPMFFRQNHFELLIINLEQRIYLPLIGVAITFCYLISLVLKRNLMGGIIVIGSIIIIVFSGLAYIHSEAFRDVFRYTQAAIDKNPDNFDAYNYRATKFYEIHDFPAALENYKKATEIYPDRNIDFTIAKIKFETGDYIGSEEDLTLIINSDSTTASGYYERGLVKEVKGDTNGAILDWKRAYEHGVEPAGIKLKKYVR